MIKHGHSKTWLSEDCVKISKCKNRSPHDADPLAPLRISCALIRCAQIYLLYDFGSKRGPKS